MSLTKVTSKTRERGPTHQKSVCIRPVTSHQLRFPKTSRDLERIRRDRNRNETGRSKDHKDVCDLWNRKDLRVDIEKLSPSNDPRQT